jgi:hypothetical protein
MASGSTFPTTIDSISNKIDGVDDILAAETNIQSSAIEALEAKVGATNSAVTTSHDYKLKYLLNTTLDGQVLTADAASPAGVKWAANPAGFADPTTTRGDLITRNATVVTRLAVGTAGQYLGTDGTDPAWTTFPAGELDQNILVNQIFA